MKLLFLTAYFHPEKVASSIFSANRYEAFANHGFEMKVITPIPTRGIDSKCRKLYSKDLRNEIMYNGKMEVIRFSLFQENRNVFLRLIRYICQFFIQLYLGAKEKNIDVIFVSSTPPIQGVLAVWLKKVLKCKFVYNLQDVFPDSLLGSGLVKKKGILWRLGRFIEDYIYRNADKIIVISEDFKKNILEKGVDEAKIEVIYNWVDEKSIMPIPKESNTLILEFGLNLNTFKVVYAGNLGHAQNVMVLLKAASQMRNISGIEFLVFGTGGMEQLYKSFVQENQLNNVKFYPLQPIEKIPQVYSLADVSLVSCKKGLGGSAMPSKTWSILSTGTPVLCSFDKGGELQHIIEKNKLGLFSEADNVDELVSNILYLFNNRSECLQMGKNGRMFIEKNLTKEIGTTKYVNVIRQFEE